jgi:hypothetical protein
MVGLLRQPLVRAPIGYATYRDQSAYCASNSLNVIPEGKVVNHTRSFCFVKDLARTFFLAGQNEKMTCFKA